MWKILFFGIFIAFNSSSGNALKCYGCIASADSDCYRGVKPSYFHQECRPIKDSNLTPLKHLSLNDTVPLETVCVYLVYKDYEPDRLVERGCGYIFQGVDICQYISLLENLESCTFCTSELCNSNPIPNTLL